MKKSIIARKPEISILENAYQSKESEFIAVYGRRRVGKTFLIRHFFENKKCLFFQTAGILKARAKVQLDTFKKDIEQTFYAKSKLKLESFSSWMSALEQLNAAIEHTNPQEKIVLFFDEFPWMAKRQANLLQALDYYWNRYWSDKPNVTLIICGSAASWIIKNILNNKGGLHNRVTKRLLVEPFTLSETKAFLDSRGVNYDHAQILQLYMCIGGIPHYLKEVKKGLSAIQNINQLCFQKNGPLLDEFNNLYSALFQHSERHEAIIRLIAAGREGISRQAIESRLLHKGGDLTLCLKELEHAGFIASFIPWGKTQKGLFYKVIDEYTLFYLTWIDPASSTRMSHEFSAKYWEEIAQTSAWKAWAGYAFEAICYKHMNNIKHALHIPDGALASSWRYTAKKGGAESGAQIDLLFDRPDGIINLCEIKYANNPYKLEKEYAQTLDKKIDIFKEVTQTKKQVKLSMMTTFGVKKSMYAEDLVWSQATADDLFDPRFGS